MFEKYKMNWRIFSICFAFLIDSGSAALRPRIIGGEITNIEDFPYQASIRVKGTHVCGGIIIGDRHILTAAHCITASSKEFVPPYDEVSVSTGTTSSAETGESYTVVDVFIHPEYADTFKKSFNNDVAVIKLASQIHFNERQQKIKMVNHDVKSAIEGTLTGWGRTAVTSSCKHSIQLRKLRMLVLSSKDCQKYHLHKIYKEQLCAFQRPGHGSCYGDSGGPLVVDDEVIGILSWVADDGFAVGTAEVFTSVYAQKEFIGSAMKK